MDRRTFVKTLAGLAGAAGVPLQAAAQLRVKTEAVPERNLQPAPAVLTAPAPAPAPAPATTSSTASGPAASTSSSASGQKFGYLNGPAGLLLEGSFAGFVTEVEGGDARAEVVREAPGSDGVAHKHVGSVRYTDLSLRLVEPPSPAVVKWIKGTFDGSPVAMNAAILSTDLGGTKAIQRELFHARLEEIRFPELDASARDLSGITLVLSPERTRFGAGDAAKLAGAKSAPRRPRATSFRLSIPGLETACAHVAKIEALTFKQKIDDSAVGAARTFERTPGALEVSDLVLSVPEVHAQGFFEWFEESVIKGNASEKNGTLELLAPNLKDVLLTVGLHGLGISEVRAARLASNADAVKRTQVSMYLERATLK